MTDKISEIKLRQRKIAVAGRNSLSDENRRLYSELICNKLSELNEIKEAKTILSYKAIGSEVDLSEFDKIMQSLGKIVAYPLSEEGNKMTALFPKPKSNFVRGKYGILAPQIKDSEIINPEDIDIVITPLVAFDDDNNRLGHGCGYYDAYLPACKRAYIIGAAFTAQRLGKIAIEPHDIKLHRIVHE
ncbi:MAG: 5-formyltetrahydrofolate cyclo-ligase [Ruminococcaceae bacterium]|nr:5-formyltetrahydrofolate cyclo-ligase [Oscillospiraceae bacterium]